MMQHFLKKHNNYGNGSISHENKFAQSDKIAWRQFCTEGFFLHESKKKTEKKFKGLISKKKKKLPIEGKG